MGKEKTSGSTTTNFTSSTTPTPTAEEVEMNKLDLDRRRAQQGGLMESDQGSLQLLNQILRGGTLPGYLQKLPEGVSEDVTKSLVNESIQDIQPIMQRSGILDSGVNASISARTAGDIRRQSYETNLNLLLNLLNLATGAPAQIQQPMLGSSALLSQRLSGLRSTTTTGSQSGTSLTTGMNPFWKSFQQSYGKKLRESL